jgi:hypothetical protein
MLKLSMKTLIPGYIKKYFWGDDLSQLSWPDHKQYICKTILEKGDKKAVLWLFKKINKTELKKMLAFFNLDPTSKNFWEIYL